MPANRLMIGLLLLCASATLVRAQTPDPCATAITQLDIDTCYAQQWKMTDLSLNHTYRATVLALEHELDDARKHSDNDQLSLDSAAIADLKAAQDAWIKYRDLHCKAAGQQVQGGSIQPFVISQCMTLVTQHRIEEIRAAYAIGGRKLE